MGNFVQVGNTNELEDGTMKEIAIQGQKILLAKVGDKYYATEGRCPHMGAKLSDGKLEGVVVTCPRHGSQFDLNDGHVVRWLKGSRLISAVGKVLKSPRPLTIYRAKVEDDSILIEI